MPRIQARHFISLSNNSVLELFRLLLKCVTHYTVVHCDFCVKMLSPKVREGPFVGGGIGKLEKYVVHLVQFSPNSQIEASRDLLIYLATTNNKVTMTMKNLMMLLATMMIAKSPQLLLPIVPSSMLMAEKNTAYYGASAGFFSTNTTETATIQMWTTLCSSHAFASLSHQRIQPTWACCEECERVRLALARFSDACNPEDETSGGRHGPVFQLPAGESRTFRFLFISTARTLHLKSRV
jgi:hypothetical protein